MTKPPSWRMNALPNELALHIAGFLDLASLTRLRAVSRRWNAVADTRAREHPGSGDALVAAAKRGCLESVKFLVEVVGADVHAQDDNALCWAAFQGHLEVVKYLVEVGKADVHAWDDWALRLAAWNGYLEIVRSAAGQGHLDVVKYLVESAGVDAQYVNALYWAAKNGHLEIVEYLKSRN